MVSVQTGTTSGAHYPSGSKSKGYKLAVRRASVVTVACDERGNVTRKEIFVAWTRPRTTTCLKTVCELIARDYQRIRSFL